MIELSSVEQEIIDHMLERRPDLADCVRGVLFLHGALITCYDQGGKLMLCGNGGSNADAMHIAGELCKSFERLRPLEPGFAAKLKTLPLGEDLVKHLEAGLAAVSIGFNGSLKTAVENDSPLRDMAFAQEVCALAKPGDVLIGISTSGNAANCLMAMSVAKASGAVTASLTGPKGGKMAASADIAIEAPGTSTAVVQEAHIVLYHTICSLIEAHYFPERRV
ncbi:MAG: SIS domain-containing protein [Candidatus Hydrogenedentes bacterium]|nr:SIS domain-containing protein [Candidatus Hydrogenedentota bacterium]